MAKETVCEPPLCDPGLKLALFFLLIVLAGGVLVAMLNPRPVDVSMETPVQDSIYADGIAQRDVSPDLLKISLGVETQEKTAAESQSANAAAINAIKGSLLANGVAARDIRTSQYTVYPVTTSRRVCPAENPDCKDWEATWVEEIIGYKTVHMLAIESTNLDSAGTLVDASVRSGANKVDYISFTLRDETRKSVEDSLVAEAMADAKSKARRIASGLGVSVGKVTSASVSRGYYPVVMEYRMMDAAAPGTGFSPGQLTISVSATAAFGIGQ